MCADSHFTWLYNYNSILTTANGHAHTRVWTVAQPHSQLFIYFFFQASQRLPFEQGCVDFFKSRLSVIVWSLMFRLISHRKKRILYFFSFPSSNFLYWTHPLVCGTLHDVTPCVVSAVPTNPPPPLLDPLKSLKSWTGLMNGSRLGWLDVRKHHRRAPPRRCPWGLNKHEAIFRRGHDSFYTLRLGERRECLERRKKN